LNEIRNIDYILVGQGLAGSCTAIQLLQREKTILVIDRIRENSATRVAAGLFNPITGKNLTKTWLADTFFSYLHAFYEQAQQLTGEKFFNPMPLYRPFISAEEQNAWMGKSADEPFLSCIEHIHTSPFKASQVKNEMGGLLLRQCGFLNTEIFCKAVRNFISQQNFLLEEDFEEDKLRIDEAFVEYKNYKAKKIIFCQGEQATGSSLFSWLPIKPLKGETLTIKTSEDVQTIFNRGVYLVPGTWKAGATYDFNDNSRTITQKGFNELKNKLDELICFPYEITGHSWGMRPVTNDRRPILGAHPNHNSVIIFNGLGTKGVSLAPYFSKVLTDWLENGQPINKEVDIHRYKHYYYAGNPLR